MKMNMAERRPAERLSNIIVREREETSEGGWLNKAAILKVLAFLSPSLLLVLWEILAYLGFIDVRLFSSPSRIFTHFFPTLYSGELLYHTWISAQRIVFGFLVGAIPGMALGLAMGLFPPIRASLMPMVAATFPIPKLALMPLILIIFGLGEASKIFTIAIGVFYLVLINTMAGVMNIDNIYFDVAKSFGAKPLQTYLTVAFPGALPMIFAGCKLGMGTALILVVAAELSAAKAGVGWMIWRAYDMFDIERMFVALITMAFLGYIFSYLLEILERLVVPWKGDRG